MIEIIAFLGIRSCRRHDDSYEMYYPKKKKKSHLQGRQFFESEEFILFLIGLGLASVLGEDPMVPNFRAVQDFIRKQYNNFKIKLRVSIRHGDYDGSDQSADVFECLRSSSRWNTSLSRWTSFPGWSARS